MQPDRDSSVSFHLEKELPELPTKCANMFFFVLKS